MTAESERAESDLKQATENNPRSIVAWTKLAKCLEEKGRRKASAEAWTRAAQLYIEENRIKEASRTVRRALRNKSRHPEALRIEGVLQRDHGYHHTAEKLLKRSLRIEPSNAQTWTDLGILFYDMEQYKEAKEALKRALFIDPDILSISQYYALVLADTRRLTKAISIMRRVEDNAFDADYEFWFHYGVLLWKGGLLDESKEALRRAVRPRYENQRLHPKAKKARGDIGRLVKEDLSDYDVLIKLGSLFEEASQNRLAEWAYRLASRAEPKRLDAWILIYDITTSGRDAEEVIEKADLIDSRHPDVLLRQAEEFYKAGMKREAVQTFLDSWTEENGEYVDRRIAEIEGEMMECWGGYEPPYDY